MKHLIHIRQSAAPDHCVPGGPGPVIARIVERFEAEAVYMGVGQREVFMVCDLSSADMAELMLACTQLTGQYAELTPVVDGREFGAVMGKAMPAAQRLLDGR